MLLNADLGESFGTWFKGMDHAVMPYIDQASIACGFHAGDPLAIHQALTLAQKHNVTIGAHPSYPDLVGFGRRHMHCDPDELRALMTYQIAALDGMAASLGLQISYVKPHGALYNDMMKSDSIRLNIMQAIANYHRPLHLMLQATVNSDKHRNEAERAGIFLYFEAFADRAYDQNGLLVNRQDSLALHSHDRMLDQVRQLVEDGAVTTLTGKVLTLHADTLCVHGDNRTGVEAIAHIRQLLNGNAE